MVRLDAFDDLRGLTSRFNPSCGLLELPAIRGQVRATDLEESLDRDADEMFREDHSLVLASAQGEVLLESLAVDFRQLGQEETAKDAESKPYLPGEAVAAVVSI